MNEMLTLGVAWWRPSAGLPTLQWSLLLAAAAAAGHLIQRFTGLPKVAGYSLVGTAAGLAGFSGAAWPLQGVSLFLMELAVAVVLFEAGSRLSVRWFRHNPMVLVQSLVESVVTFAAVHAVLVVLGVDPAAARVLALIGVAASPAVLLRVVHDIRASGPVTERAIALSTLNTLYALSIGSALAGVPERNDGHWFAIAYPVFVVLGLSFVVAALMFLAMRTALRFMNPTSENTGMLLLALIAAGAALAAQFGGSAALAGLLGGLLLKQFNPRPWVWPSQMGSAASMLVMLSFVLVSTVAAQGTWSLAVAGTVLAWLLVRGLARIAALSLTTFGSGMRLPQAAWAGCAMSPLSSVALLLTTLFAAGSPSLGPTVSSIALPSILLMEVAGAILTTVALRRAGESSRRPGPASQGGNHGA